MKHRAALTGLAAGLTFLLSACEGKEEPPRANFGAGMVANYMVKAQAKCAASGQVNIAECAESMPRGTDARMAALTAQEAYRMFQEVCYPDMGMSKCEGLVEKAYQEAKSR